MANIWKPPDVSGICSNDSANLTACSSSALMFLAFVTKFYGSATISLPKYNPYSETMPCKTKHASLSAPPQDLPNYSDKFFVASNSPYQSNDNNDQFYVSQNSNFAKQNLKLDNSKLGSMSKEDSGRRNRDVFSQEILYDFIIVGAGSAGCVVANRLSEIKKWRILLLEAGPEEPDVTSVPALPPILGGSNIDWGYKTQPEKLTCRAYTGHSCSWTRGKCLGGSSALNNLVYLRGHRDDYDNWSNMGNPGWSYDEVLPYFKKAENNRNFESYDSYYHGSYGPLNVERYPFTDVNTVMLVEALNETGLPIKDLNTENNIGTEIVQSTSLDGRRWSANMAYIRRIRCVRPNLHIILNAFVTKVIINPLTKLAEGVTYLRDGKYYEVYARKEIIVSSGSLNSPKILMLSGVGPKDHLQSINISVIIDLQVGRNLQDHVTTEALVISLSNKTSTLIPVKEMTDELKKYYQQPLDQKSGPMSSTTTVNAIGFIKTKYSKNNAPDIQFRFNTINEGDFYANPPEYLMSNTLPTSFYNALTLRPVLLIPDSRGEILLNETDPVFSQPLIYSGFFTVQKDVNRLIEGIIYATKLEETLAFKGNGAFFNRKPVKGCESYIWGTYEYFYCLLVQYTGTIYHPAGTCKMGPARDKTAVVDARLRIYGIKNLRVIDASIMPNIVRANINAPTIMVAEKGADMIKEDCNA